MIHQIASISSRRHVPVISEALRFQFKGVVQRESRLHHIPRLVASPMDRSIHGGRVMILRWRPTPHVARATFIPCPRIRKNLRKRIILLLGDLSTNVSTGKKFPESISNGFEHGLRAFDVVCNALQQYS